MFIGINFLHYSIIIFSIISLSIIFSSLFNKKISETVSTSNLFIVFFLYWFAIFNYLEIGFYILIISIFVLFIICLFFKRKYIVKSFAIDIFIYTSLVFFIGFIFKNYFIYSWDDLSHWGLTAKDMYLQNAIIKRDYNDYPIGTRLFQYFMLKVYGSYNESVLLTYFYMLYFSFAIYPLKYINFKSINNILITIFYMILVILLPICFIIFDDFAPFKIFRFLMVDLLLGLTFGFGLYLVSIKKNFTRYDIIQISLLLFFLIQIKVVALMFAVTLLLYIIIRNTSLKKAIKEGIIFLIPVVLSKLSWFIYIKYYNYSSYLSDRFYSSNNIISVNDFLNLYVNALKYKNIFLYFSVVDILIISIILRFIFVFLFKNLRLYTIKLSILLSLLIIIYNIGLYLTYMNVFHSIEKTNLFSYERYQVLLFSGFIFFIVLFIPQIFLFIKNYCNAYLLGLLLIVSCFFIGNFTYYKYKEDTNIPKYTKKLRKNIENISLDFPKNSKNKMIVIISDDFSRLNLRYLTGYNIFKHTNKKSPNIIVLYNRNKYKQVIINYFYVHNINLDFDEIKNNIIVL